MAFFSVLGKLTVALQPFMQNGKCCPIRCSIFLFISTFLKIITSKLAWYYKMYYFCRYKKRSNNASII